MAPKKQNTINLNHIKSLITPDWTKQDGPKCFYQDGVIIEKEGSTSLVEDHTHSYTLDENGDGETTEAVHPDAPQIHHKHQVTNWEIRSSQSECYPDCEQQFGVTGSAPHIHSFVASSPFPKMLPPRYSATIVTDYISTGGSKLQARMDEQVSKGIRKILKFYNKQNSTTAPIRGWAEGWFVPERPGSKLKVLVSVPSIQVDSLSLLPVPLIESLPIPWEKIDLNSQGLDKKLKGAEQLLSKYSSALNNFYGTIRGVSLSSQANRLATIIPVLTTLMLKNGYAYSSEKSALITLGITQEYRVQYALLDADNKLGNLYYGFDLFLNSTGIKDDRTIFLLTKLDRLYELYISKEQMPWHDFFQEFILHPPEIDFSKPPRKSERPSEATNDLQERLDRPWYGMKAWEDLQFGFDPEVVENMQKTLDTSTNYVGDTIMTGLDNAGDWLEDLDAGYNRILNNLPLPNLIKAALECLGFQGLPGMDFLHLSKRFLNDLSMYTGEATALFKIPRSPLGYKLPTVDQMGEMMKQMGLAIKEALAKAFMTMIIQVIEGLLDACNECALQNKAAGRTRFANLNFGGLDLSTLINLGAPGTVVVGTMDAIMQGGLGAMGITADRSAAALGETNHISGDPIMSTAPASVAAEAQNRERGWGGFGSKDTERKTRISPTGEKMPPLTEQEIKDKQAQIQFARQQFGDFLRGASSILTPGEIGNLLMGCEVGNEAMGAIQGLLSKFPAIKDTLDGDGNDPDTVKKFFAKLGTLIGPPNVVKSVQKASDDFEFAADCLCDTDDAALRKQLLEQKEDMTPEQIAEQIKNSDARYQKRVQELVKNLNENPLENALPPIFCTIDPETGLVKKGLIEHDHPTFDTMMDDVLDVCFDSIGTAFNSEAANYYSSMETFPIKKRVVPRTKDIFIPKYGTMKVLNPEFMEMVSQGIVSYGSLDYEATKPIEFIKSEGDYDYENPNDEDNHQKLRDEGGFFSFFSTDDPYAQRAAVGLWEPGQRQPTGEQEYLWELANVTVPGPWSEFAIRGGRYMLDTTSTDAMYTRKYGSSPIPVVKQERGPGDFAPGLKESYEQFCTEIIDFEKRGAAYFITRLNMPNQVLENAGIDPKGLDRAKSSLGGTEGLGGMDKETMQASLDAMTRAFRLIGDGKINLDYTIRIGSSAGAGTLGSGFNAAGELVDDVYSITITMDMPDVGDGPNSYPIPVREPQVDRVPIHPKALSSIQYNSINIRDEPRRPTINQDKCFLVLLGKSWSDGGNIWRDGQRFTDKENYASGLKLPPAIIENLKSHYYNSGSYTEIYKELMCSVGNQIGKSPFFNKDFLAALNLAPMRESGQALRCVPHLLDIETLKTRIKDEYGTVQCIEQHLPNVDGKTSIKNNPFEAASLGGAVLVLVRTFVAEYLLRSIFSFFYFRYRTPADVDSTIISYIFNKINSDIKERSGNDFGNFERASAERQKRELEASEQPNWNKKPIPKKQTYNDLFQEQTIKLYNRNVPKSERTSHSKKGFELALKYLIRFQIWSVSNRLSYMANALGDISLDAILLNEWLPTYDIAKNASDVRLHKSGSKLDDNSNRPYVTADEINGLRKGYISDKEMAMIKYDVGNGIFWSNPVGWIYKYYFPEFGAPIAGVSGSAGKSGITLRKEVWSQETLNPQTEKPQYTKTGQDGNYISYSKRGGSNPFNARVWWLMNEAKDRAGESLVLNFPGLSQTGSSTPIQWTYGISDNERKGIQLLTRILSGINAISSPPGKMSPQRQADPDYYIQTAQPAAHKGPPGGVNEIVAPGSGLMWWSSTFRKRASNPVTLVPSRIWPGVNHYPWNDWAADDFEKYLDPWMKTHLGSGKKWTADLYIASPIINHADIDDAHGEIGTIWTDVFGEDTRYGQVKDRTGDAHRSRMAWGPPPQPGHSATFVNAPRFATIHGKTVGPWIWTNRTRGRDYQWVYMGKPGVTVNVGGYKYNLPVMENKFVETSLRPSRVDNMGFKSGVIKGKLFDVERSEGLDESGHHILGAKWGEGFPVTIGGGPAAVGMFNNAIEQLNNGTIPYLSLLDFDLRTGLNILVWERCRLEENRRYILTYSESVGPVPQWLNDAITAYEKWIGDWEQAMKLIFSAEHARMAIRKATEERLMTYPVKRRPMEEPLTKDLSNGNLIVEPYIRVKDLPMPVPSVFAYPAEIKKNAEYVQRNDSYLKGLVNIEKFEEFIKSKFNPSVFPINEATGEGQPVSNAFNRIIREASAPPPPLEQECGPELANLGFSRIVSGETVKFKLGHFFEDISVGIRISYVSAPDDFTSNPQNVPVFEEAKSSNTNSLEISQKEKAYFVPEQLVDDPFDSGTRNVHIVPLINYEKSISMDTFIEDVFIDPSTNHVYTREVREIVNGTIVVKNKDIGFFRKFYEDNGPEIIDSLIETDEYQLLFKYLFPLDRMLSLNNIYAAEYMTSYKDLDDSFDMTKEDIKYLFFALSNSGDPYYDCGPSNSDLALALLNGIDVKGLMKMMAMMIIKTALIVFKSFVEVIDPNIAMSKNILKLIRTTNKLIAAAQVMAQQAQAAGQAAAEGATGAWEAGAALLGGDEEECAESGQQDDMTKPPDKWFDPIDRNFLPDSPPLQTWMISLMLLPVNLIPFIGIGPPVTPFAFVYWALDYKPEPNWLSQMPPSDFLDNLFSKEANEVSQEVIGVPCDIDIGLSAPGSYDFEKDEEGE